MSIGFGPEGQLVPTGPIIRVKRTFMKAEGAAAVSSISTKYLSTLAYLGAPDRLSRFASNTPAGVADWNADRFLRTTCERGETKAECSAAHHASTPISSAGNESVHFRRTACVLLCGCPWSCIPCHRLRSDKCVPGTGIFPVLSNSRARTWIDCCRERGCALGCSPTPSDCWSPETPRQALARHP